MQEFYINHNSLNPQLRMGLLKSGRYDFSKFHECIQDATITFSMFDVDTGIYKIINKPAILELTGNCSDEFNIVYKWTKKDVNKCGTYKGLFTINFNGNLIKKDTEYPSGNLIVPIKDDLLIVIK